MIRIALDREKLLTPIVGVLAPLGWATHGRWHKDEMVHIVELANKGAPPDEIDDMVTELWHTKSKVFLKNVAAPLRLYGQQISHDFQRQNFQRANLVDQALECHFAGYYAAATLLTYAQIDGLTRDVTGASFFSGSSNDKYLDDKTLAGIAGNLPVVREFFVEPIDTTDFHTKLSRHGAAHGRDLSFGTRTNSTKALVLFGALVEYLEDRAQREAQRRQRQNESTVKGLTGVDGTGRLIDDRQLDAIYFFWADLNAYIHGDVVAGNASFDRWPDKAHSLMGQRRMSRKYFVWGGGDHASYWWHYKTPSGHYMGAAAKLYSEGLPIDWREWLWDAAEAPTGPPWGRSENGWRRFNGSDATPNWTIREFPSG